MKKSFLRTTLTPIITVLLCCLLYISGYYQMIYAALLVIIASAIEYPKEVFQSLGFHKRNFTAKNLLFAAPLTGVAIFFIYSYLLLPLVIMATGQPIDYSVFNAYEGNLPAIISLFFLIWASAAFAEEIIFRGYLMQQFSKFFGSNYIALAVNILLFGFLFGYTHAYQGLSGQILSGITGMLLALIFHIRKNDLWFNIVVHGFIDTVALVYIYFGWL